MIERINAQDAIGGSLIRNGGIVEGNLIPHFEYRIECRDRHGNVKWTEEFWNTVMTGGKNDLLDKYFSGSGYTAAWYFMLISATSYTTGPAAGDTMASHAGWAEDVNYSNATRPVIAFAAAAAGAKATSAASAFNINGTTTIKGAGITTVNTKSGTTGILFSAGLFTAGDRAVVDLDVLNVTGTWAS